MALPLRAVDWQPLRDAYVKRENRPTYEELAAEFAVSVQGIQRTSSEEAWPALRNSWLESQVRAADGQSIILQACKGDRAVTQAYLSLAIVTLAQLQNIVESIPPDRAPATRAEAINTCMFAAKNLADSLKSVGIVGIARVINQAGDAGNGRWDPGLLTQINLTVQNMQASDKASGQPVSVIASEPTKEGKSG